MQTGTKVSCYLIIIVFGLLAAGCTTTEKWHLAGVNTPDTTLYYRVPTTNELHELKVPLGSLRVGMTRQTMLETLKPERLLSIDYHGGDALNIYWLRPGVKIALHFSNRNPLLAVPDELPHGEPDDVLLDLPDSIFIAAGSNAPESEKSWQKVRITDLN
jgi:hypothetical protein